MIYLAGHSLGAARAVLYAYARIRRGMPVDGLYLFGCPNPGNAALGTALRPAVGLIRSIKNGRDLITDVPVDMPILNEQYVQPKPFEEISEAPVPGDKWGPFAWHHIELYQAGCRKLASTASVVELVPAVDAVARLYNSTDDWHWLDSTDGQYTATTIINGAKLLIFRGSTTGLDWLDDFEAWQVEQLGAKVSHGFWTGVGPILDKLDAAVA